MKIISHRGNTNGPEKFFENSPEYIQKALDMGFDVEIDLRIKNGTPHLGHDAADHPVSVEWLRERRNNLWIHVKERKALEWIVRSDLVFFCHESDPYVLISNGYIWAHDLTLMNSKFIIPLLSKESLIGFDKSGFYGVCSDFPLECRRLFFDLI
jgi:hypothetical protein